MNQGFDKSVMETLVRKAESEGIERYSVGVGILNASGALLVLKRKIDDSFPGVYELPGGGVKKGETLYEAVCRETREETGLIVKDIHDYCGMFDYNEKGRTRQFNYLVSVQDHNNITLSEHDGFLWIDTVKGLRCTTEMKQVIEGIKRIGIQGNGDGIDAEKRNKRTGGNHIS